MYCQIQVPRNEQCLLSLHEQDYCGVKSTKDEEVAMYKCQHTLLLRSQTLYYGMGLWFYPSGVHPLLTMHCRTPLDYCYPGEGEGRERERKMKARERERRESLHVFLPLLLRLNLTEKVSRSSDWSCWNDVE